MKRLVLIVLALVAFASSPALAEVKTHPTAKVSLDVPTGWKMQSKGDVMTVSEPKDEMAFFLIVVEAADLKKAVAVLDVNVAKLVSDVKWAAKEPQATKLNGMDALVNKGGGKVQGKDVNLALLLVKTPSGKLLLVLGVVEASKKDAHKAEAQAFVESIKPAP